MQQTLLLDSSYYPLQMIDWKKALTLFFTQRAEVVEHHQDVVIRSPNQEYQLPKVMRLFCKIKKIQSVKFNRMNVFYRDNFTCQYCAGKFKSIELTLDHVYPKSKGGKSNWINIVSACHDCNNKKADKLPRDCGMHPLKKPKEPQWIAMFLLKLSHHEKHIWSDWFASKSL
ncbi:MAG: HNH endonuclease [Halobacteriovoraceae bacterium]|nr:HNH endonuclease [Halobacteriovoraceae bacterium]|tara:strand:- start:18016 stop:18528 length:513 start_codon:yes stop_codon:yes gene_type:complete